MEEEKLTPRTVMIRNILKWTLLLILLHVIALILYSMTGAPMVKQSIEYEDGIENSVTVLFAFLFMLGFCVYGGIEYARDGTAKHRHVSAMKAAGYGSLRFLLSEMRPLLYKVPTYLVFQLPMLLFTAVFGYSHLYQTPLEKFYAADAGFYLALGNPFLGWLLSGVTLTVMTAVAYFVVILLRERENRSIDRSDQK